MANFLPVFLALALNVIVIDAENSECFQYPTYLIFSFVVFVLMWDACVYPKNFIRTNACCEFIIEFVILTFLMNFILLEFLIPLEKAFVECVPITIGECIQEGMSAANLDIACVNDFCKFLGTDDAKTTASYGLAISFLIFILHATRLINIKILICDGLRPFIFDATARFKSFAQNQY